MRSMIFGWIALALGGASAASADRGPLVARVECSLATSAGQIRQFAFDGDPETFFASAEKSGADDHFTLVLDREAALKSVEVTTGRPDGTSRLDLGGLELSRDGRTFEEVAKFRQGVARFEAADRLIKAIRIRPDAQSARVLLIREIQVELAEPLPPFAYPVEIAIDVTDAPEMRPWAEKAAGLCERWYPVINEELKTEGYRPPNRISMALRRDYLGVAEAGGSRITGSVAYFRDHPDDFGAMIHETCHVVQDYPGGDNPGWLVEGVADYVRFFVYEPGQAGPVAPDRAHYDQSYRTSASFLAFVSARYDKKLVLELNKLMREGKYKEESFRTLTGKTVRELDAEWLASLRNCSIRDFMHSDRWRGHPATPRPNPSNRMMEVRFLAELSRQSSRTAK